MKKQIVSSCLICGDTIIYNPETNDGVVYIKTKRKSVLVIHKTCIEKEKKQNEHIKSKEEQKAGK